MRLFIRITGTGTTEPHALDALEWLLLDKQGTLVSQGSGDLAMLDELIDLKTIQDPADIVLLVPTEYCLSMRCTVPGRTLGQMRRALPYVVEEFIAGDIDAMHVVAGPLRRGGAVDGVLIARAGLRGWVRKVAGHGGGVALGAP